MNYEPLVILITCQNFEEAKRITEALVGDKFIACGNIIPKMSSIFRWQNKIEHQEESLIIAKSRKSLFQQIVTRVKSLHSYETPEIIALPVVLGSEEYLNWLSQETSRE